MQPRELVNGRFEIERLAGSGGMGTVYRAIDRRTGEHVALKVLTTHHSPEDAERFEREAALLEGLCDPGIVRFIASGVTPDREAFLVMEWLEGESLAKRLTRGPLSVVETIELGRRVAVALHAAHARGVVHRDLKPPNLFLPQNDLARVMILDFGIARVLETGQTLTKTGATLGSPGFMSPEQTRGEKNIDARSDVFSLACVLFKCLTGQPPFTGDPLGVMIKVVKDPAPHVRELRPEVPPALDDLLDRMLAKAPDARPRDGASVATELAALAEAAPPRSVSWQGVLRGSHSPTSARGGTVALTQAQEPATPMSARYGPPGPTQQEPPSGYWSAAPAPSSITSTGQYPAPTLQPASQPSPPDAGSSRAPLVVLGLIGGGLLALGVGAVIFFTYVYRPRAVGSPVVTAAAMPCVGLKCGTFTAADPMHVDAMDLLPTATQLAQSVDKGVTLCEVMLSNAVDGTAPIGPDIQHLGGGVVGFRFTTGRGARSVDVTATPGHLLAIEGSCAHSVPVPACTPKAAARAAVQSGVSRSAPATMIYHHDDGYGGPTWEYVAQGTQRRMDGRTCAIKYKPPK